MYKPIDKHYEEARLTFVLKRDGLEAAIAFAKQMIKVYGATVKSYKAKRCFNHPYRYGYTESAMSARHLLRTKFLEKLDANLKFGPLGEQHVPV